MNMITPPKTGQYQKHTFLFFDISRVGRIRENRTDPDPGIFRKKFTDPDPKRIRPISKKCYGIS